MALKINIFNNFLFTFFPPVKHSQLFIETKNNLFVLIEIRLIPYIAPIQLDMHRFFPLHKTIFYLNL